MWLFAFLSAILFVWAKTCVILITGSWIMGSINSCAHTIYVLHLPYCRSRAINHFFCDVPAMVNLACMDTSVYEYTVFVSTVFFLVLPFIGIVYSYSHVLTAVYCMHSVEGRRKAYSTCSTHLTVVTFYYMPFAYSKNSIYAQDPFDLQQRTRFWLSSTLSWPQCLIPSSTAWETRRWREPWGEWFTKSFL